MNVLDTDYPKRGVAIYALVILILASILSLVDRSILTLMVQPLRADLGISDVQVSLLQGLAFSFFYAIMGIPLGLLVDRRNRRNLIAIGILVWSLMTVACGLSTSFEQLFAARIGVGVGEAILLPAAYSLLADFFPPGERARANGIFTISIFAGGQGSLIIGGLVLRSLEQSGALTWPLIGTLSSWQSAFVIVGLPGLLLAPLLLTMVEPARRSSLGRTVALAESELGIRGFINHWRQHRATVTLIIVIAALVAFVYYSCIYWMPTFFFRKFGIPAASAGVMLGLSVAPAGIIGCLLGGYLGDRWTREGKVGDKLRVMFIWWAGALPAILLLPFAPNVPTTLLLCAIIGLLNALAVTTIPSLIQDAVPNQLRGLTTGIYLLLAALIGFGIGPTATALVTEQLFGDDSGLIYAVAIAPLPVLLLGLCLTWFAFKPFAATVQSERSRLVAKAAAAG